LVFLSIKCSDFRVYNEEKIDIIQVHIAYHGMLPAYLLSKIVGIPYVVTCHGSDIRILRKRVTTRLWQKILLHNASHIIAVSNEIKNLLIQEYDIPPRSISVIPNGYDDKLIKLIQTNIADQATSKNITLVFVGGLRSVKDPLTLIDAFMMISENQKNVQLHIVGDGDLRLAIEKKIKFYGLQDRITLHGHLPHENVLRILSSSDIFVLTSVEEGLPTSLIEAMALGKPVIATNVGGIPEIVKDGVNGILVPPKSPKSVSEALEKLLANIELRKKLAEAAIESVKDYSWSKIAKKYERIYHKILRKTKNND